MLFIAIAARTRADCVGRKVGAVIEREGRVISTGYNGTPIGIANCSEGGCLRCSNRKTDEKLKGGSYDYCICVHAEENALLTAARFGEATLGASVTSTLQPCFGCLKELLQAGIKEVRFMHPWIPNQDLERGFTSSGLLEQYKALSQQFETFGQIGDPNLDDPDFFKNFIA